ncbi:MAG: hypothetical protein MUQ00_08990, partial [Candidatus Aminicenantes bacterium]|nr:hypothetical protein [Candidatus Aminicenantes bacterium]
MKIIMGVITAAACAVFLFGRGPAPIERPDQAGPWTSLGPSGGDIRGLARNPKSPGELYAVSSSWPSQIFRSTNAGASWTRQSIV